MRSVPGPRTAMCNTEWYTGLMAQLIARVPEEILDEIDALVSSGAYESRSDLVREALAYLLDHRRRVEIGRRIVEGYERFPETEAEIRSAEASARAMVEEEPW